MPRPNLAQETEDDTFTDEDWKELMANRRPGGSTVMSAENSEAVIVGVIAANKQRSAYQYFRGYSIADTESPWKLRRFQPLTHPVWPGLRCHAISFDDFAPMKNPTTDTANPGYNKPKRESIHPDNPLHTGYYGLTEVTLTFKPFSMEYWEDEQEGSGWDGKEYKRNVIRFKNTEPSLELLTVQNRFIKFIEGTPDGTEFEGSTHERKCVVNYILHWSQVEESFVYNEAGYPDKLMACVGRVNKDTFLGFSPETALMGAPVLTRYAQNLRTDTGIPIYAVDIDIPLSVFDPVPALGREVSLGKGWNLFPWSDEGDAAGTGPAWYAAERPDHSPYIATADFEEAFTHVLS